MKVYPRFSFSKSLKILTSMHLLSSASSKITEHGLKAMKIINENSNTKPIPTSNHA